MRKVTVLLATWGGVGFIPLAPGTMGTAAAIPLFLLLSILPLPIYVALLLFIALVACWVAGQAEGVFDQCDSPVVVVDEVVGFLVTMTALPASLSYIIAGFVLFRLFDVLKPPPIRLVERKVKGGYGVVLDDVVAGVYACVVLHVLSSFFPYIVS